MDVVFMNHSRHSQPAACRVVLPKVLGAQASPWAQGNVMAKSEGRVAVSFRIPPNASPGRYVVPVDVKHGPWHLPQLIEAIVDVA